jgi:hypothetical protein
LTCRSFGIPKSCQFRPAGAPHPDRADIVADGRERGVNATGRAGAERTARASGERMEHE